MFPYLYVRNAQVAKNIFMYAIIESNHKYTTFYIANIVNFI